MEWTLKGTTGAISASHVWRPSLDATRVHQTRSLVVLFFEVRTVFDGNDAPRRLAVDCAFGKGRNAVRASGVLRFALRRAPWVNANQGRCGSTSLRAPVDVTVAGLQTGVGLLSRMARTVTGRKRRPPRKADAIEIHEVVSKQIKCRRVSTDEVLTRCLISTQVRRTDDAVYQFPVVDHLTFDDDDPADVLRAQRWPEPGALVVLRMPSVVEEGDIEAGDAFVDADAEEGGGALKEEGDAVSCHRSRRSARRRL